MKLWTVTLRGTDSSVTLRAAGEVDAKLRYCKRRGVNYNYMAPLLVVTPAAAARRKKNVND